VPLTHASRVSNTAFRCMKASIGPKHTASHPFTRSPVRPFNPPHPTTPQKAPFHISFLVRTWSRWPAEIEQGYCHCWITNALTPFLALAYALRPARPSHTPHHPPLTSKRSTPPLSLLPATQDFRQGQTVCVWGAACGC